MLKGSLLIIILASHAKCNTQKRRVYVTYIIRRVYEYYAIQNTSSTIICTNIKIALF